jgi:hypothetical protein
MKEKKKREKRRLFAARTPRQNKRAPAPPGRTKRTNVKRPNKNEPQSQSPVYILDSRSHALLTSNL